ncbi:MAG: flagellar hook-associated protein FlgK [Marinicaulis sp.]|nr:flagellar hook-associated protein FlgK [Marinicaulis sp.]NNE41826.1 flagellar hook-associated protein FlgK [Marinicaulis sp.]NNL90320.1 flagellar hook-associated protein FlgK [Marinicaulis sp.]
MSISSALNNANSGLSVASRRAGVVSNNIANALTPGYVRRTASVSENAVAGTGAGVKFDGVSRTVDPAITSDRRGAESVQAREQISASTYASINSALGEPDDSFSLFAQYQQFETSLRGLSQTPESQPLQAQVLDAAKALTNKFNQLTSQAQTIRRDADAKIDSLVDQLNGKLEQIEKLNHEISITGAGGQNATALEDQRQLLIDEVSEVIPVREVNRGNGKVDLITDEGVFLIAGAARQVDFDQATTITPTETLESGALSGLTVSGVSITPNTGGTFSLKQGALAGLFETRDRIAVEFQAKIDGLSRDVIERFEGIDPTTTIDAPGLFTDAGAAFDPTNEIGLAGRITVNAAVDPDKGGAAWRIRDGLGAVSEGAAGASGVINTMLDALTALKTPPANTGLNGEIDAARAAADVTSAIGSRRISSENRLTAVTARTQALVDAEIGATGVDTDFELQQLILIEQAFAANARVIQIADRLIQQLVEL